MAKLLSSPSERKEKMFTQQELSQLINLPGILITIISDYHWPIFRFARKIELPDIGPIKVAAPLQEPNGKGENLIVSFDERTKTATISLKSPEEFNLIKHLDREPLDQYIDIEPGFILSTSFLRFKLRFDRLRIMAGTCFTILMNVMVPVHYFRVGWWDAQRIILYGLSLPNGKEREKLSNFTRRRSYTYCDRYIQAFAVNLTTIYVTSKRKLELIDRQTTQRIRTRSFGEGIKNVCLKLDNRYLYVSLLQFDSHRVQVCNLQGEVITEVVTTGPLLCLDPSRMRFFTLDSESRLEEHEGLTLA